MGKINIYDNYYNVDDSRCAPKHKFEDASCFSNDVLNYIFEELIKKFNININYLILSRINKIKYLEKIFKNKCNNQICWITKIITDAFEREKLVKEIYRPYGPEGKFEWLSTTDINNVLEQYHDVHTDFIFLGAVPYDFEDLHILDINIEKIINLDLDGISKIALVINLDTHNQSGSHWVALYIDLNKNQIYFFDSVGKPPRKRIKLFINKITKYLYHKKYNENININYIIEKCILYKKKKINYNELNNILNFDIKYNNIQHQFKNSECGVYSIHFIIELLSNKLFIDVINNIIDDDKMNYYRNKIFLNINK
jgi:hypothetical protein